jgi:hypothetical protein
VRVCELGGQVGLLPRLERLERRRQNMGGTVLVVVMVVCDWIVEFPSRNGGFYIPSFYFIFPN